MLADWGQSLTPRFHGQPMYLNSASVQPLVKGFTHAQLAYIAETLPITTRHTVTSMRSLRSGLLLTMVSQILTTSGHLFWQYSRWWCQTHGTKWCATWWTERTQSLVGSTACWWSLSGSSSFSTLSSQLSFIPSSSLKRKIWVLRSEHTSRRKRLGSMKRRGSNSSWKVIATQL